MSSQIIDETIQGKATLLSSPLESTGKMLYLESYGCAMNFADSEVVASILQGAGYATTMNEANANGARTTSTKHYFQLLNSYIYSYTKHSFFLHLY